MAGPQIPSGGLSLVGWPAEPYKYSSKDSTSQRTAALLRVNAQIIKELQEYAQNGKSIRLQGGRVPKLQYGQKSIDFQVESENFTHELYTPASQQGELSFVASITQRALASQPAPMLQDTSTTDDALASLKQSLASYRQDKESKQATISSSIIPSTKANKVLSNRYIPNSPRPTSQANSPVIGSTRAVPGQTSAPSTDPAAAAKNKAMTYALTHLLASRDLGDVTIHNLTHIGDSKRHEILSKIAELEPNKKWKLKDRAYKDLDIWKFPYPSDEGREEAIDNAVRAYDRLRLGKDDKLWQLLLPEAERGKGKCLSRLHGNQHLSATHQKKSPLGASSPLAASDTEGKPSNGRLTPNPTSTAMARTASAPGKGMSIEKRLKESQKHRVAEEAKEAKRKEKEAKSNEVTNTTTTMKTNRSANATTKKAPSKFKSDKVVHSSDDESDGEVKQSAIIKARPSNPQVRTKDARSPPGTSSSESKPLMKSSNLLKDAKKNTGANVVPSPALTAKRDQLGKPKTVIGSATPRSSSDPLKKKVDPQLDPRKATPSQRPEKHSGVSTRPQLSPRKAESRPKNSSPLGRSSATPSLFGNHERNTSVVKKVTTNAAVKPNKTANGDQSGVRPEAGKKRPATSADDETDRPRKAIKTDAAPAARKPTPATAKGNAATAGQKTKANELSNGIREHDLGYANKHRRTESASTQSGVYSSSSNHSQTTTARTSVASPSPPLNNNTWAQSPSTASSTSDPSRSYSWERALDEGEIYNSLYPEYKKLHDKVSRTAAAAVTREERRKLWELHDKLKRMKSGIYAASVVREEQLR